MFPNPAELGSHETTSSAIFVRKKHLTEKEAHGSLKSMQNQKLSDSRNMQKLTRTRVLPKHCD